jgi:hypothetical protein
MNKRIWGGIIIWGIFVTCFGFGTMNPASNVANSFAYSAPIQEVIFLLTGGIVTCLVGIVGLICFMGWIPGFSKQSGAAMDYARP